MSTSIRRVHYTYSEYLALEEESSVRHEFLNGEIYAMAGGSPDHAALAAALLGIRPATAQLSGVHI
jgi:Uma2 family endonuclease